MKFSIVTPTFNSEKYIAETIQSVISQQGDFEVEYIIIDNCSTDNTIPIVRNYEKLVKDKKKNLRCNQVEIRWISEKDNGMYEAINKGFDMATGDIYAWINASDVYCDDAFNVVQKVFNKFQEVNWLKGITSFINENSTFVQIGKCILYDQSWIQRGIYGRESYFISQESVFWRASLWKSVKKIDPGLKLAGDYYLWIRFARNSKLYSVKAFLSCFRKHEGQLSQNVKSYQKECEEISPSSALYRKLVKIRLILESKLIPRFLRPIVFKMLFQKNDFYLVDFINNNPEIIKKGYYIV